MSSLSAGLPTESHPARRELSLSLSLELARYSAIDPPSGEDPRADADVMSLSPGRDTAGVGMWTDEEHARFLEAVKLFANGPWKRVADYVGTRSVRQTMTHAQKYRLKAARRLRNMRAKSELLLKHNLSPPGAAAMHPRLLPFSDKDDAAAVARPVKSRKRGNSGSNGGGKPAKRRQYSSLDTVSITDAVSILDSALHASTPVASDVKAQTPASSREREESVRPGGDGSGDAAASDAAVKTEADEQQQWQWQEQGEDMDEELAEAIAAILDSDLAACPSLEDCASELLELLF